MSLEYTKSTDTEHEVQLESRIISARWRAALAVGGRRVPLMVLTEFVGQGAPIEIEGRTRGGAALGTLSGQVLENHFHDALEIPADIGEDEQVTFTARLPEHGLEAEAEPIPAHPPIAVTNLQWSAEEARRGDLLTLSAHVRGAPEGTVATIVIYEYDEDEAHDRITEVETRVTDRRVEITWQYEFHEDTDEVPTEEERQRYGEHYNPPEYFFVVAIEGQEYGTAQESGLLRFRDWVELEVTRADGSPAEGQAYTARLPDGTERTGELDAEGRARLEEVPPGRVRVTFAESEAQGAGGQDADGSADPTEGSGDDAGGGAGASAGGSPGGD